jgi:DNA-binding NarL/FixJ family response regulator
MTLKPNPRTLKVVTVDDSHLIVSRLKCILNDVSGVEFVENACNIPDALILLKRHLPDVVILDINLSSPDGLNGIDLLFMVRKIYPAMKVIMLTNVTNERYRTMCEEGGADFFLDKSHDFDKIPDALRTIHGLQI